MTHISCACLTVLQSQEAPAPASTSETVPVCPTTNYNQHRQFVSVLWHLSISIQPLSYQVLLKKSNLDREPLSSCCPISNTPFISKLIERMVKAQLTDHLDTNTLFNSHRSTYMKHHSTETAIKLAQISACSIFLQLLNLSSILFSWNSLTLVWIPCYCSCLDYILSSFPYFSAVTNGSVSGVSQFHTTPTPPENRTESITFLVAYYSSEPSCSG